MDNKIEQICDIVSRMSKIQEIINQNKLSYIQIQALMQLVDISKKNYLDLNDVYALVGEVTQQQLFDIFKFLDTKRTGEITKNSLQAAIGDKESKSNNITKQYIFPRFYKIVDTIKDKTQYNFKILAEYNYTEDQMKNTYKNICSILQSKYLSINQLSTILMSYSRKVGLRWTKQCQKIIKDLFCSQGILEKKFIEVFVATQNKQNKNQKQKQKNQQNHIQIQKVQNLTKQKDIPNNFKLQIQNQINLKSKITYQKTKNLINNEYNTPSFRAFPQQQIKIKQKKSTYLENNHIYCNKQDKQLFKQSDIGELFEDIQQRREKLKHDSMQRKKIIEQIIQKKKDSVGLSKTFDIYDQNLRHSNSFLSKQNIKQSRQHGYSYIKQRTPILYNQQPFFQNHQSIEKKQLKKQNFSQSYLQTSDIYKRDNLNIQSRYKDIIVPRQLLKSKSGVLQTNFHTNYQNSYNIQNDSQIFIPKSCFKQSNQQNYSIMSKQNMLKKAEQQAARKIQDIQKRARMKVLQKKTQTKGRTLWAAY